MTAGAREPCCYAWTSGTAASAAGQQHAGGFGCSMQWVALQQLSTPNSGQGAHFACRIRNCQSAACVLRHTPLPLWWLLGPAGVARCVGVHNLCGLVFVGRWGLSQRFLCCWSGLHYVYQAECIAAGVVFCTYLVRWRWSLRCRDF